MSVVSFFKYIRRIVCRISSIHMGDSFLVSINRNVCASWASDEYNKNNFGDSLNPFVLEKITGKPVVNSKNIIDFYNRPLFFFIGSILDGINRSNAVVCGAGFQKSTAVVKVVPQKVLAVRGPLSRDIFLRHSIECPEIYGDPAILLPCFFNNYVVIKEWDVGIISHYADKKVLENIAIDAGGLRYKIIDIESSIDQVMGDIFRSKIILSSSLHGIIVAHAYGIPATWIKLSGNVIGDGFKFRDYALSVGRDEIKFYDVDRCLELNRGVEMSELYDVSGNRDVLIKVFSNYFGSSHES